MKRLFAAVLCITLPGLLWADLSNTAAGTYTDSLGNPYQAASNTAVVTVFVPPLITLVKTASPTSAKSGDTVTFTIAYNNGGGSNASNVVIADTIPAGSAFVSGSIVGGGTQSGGSITWNLGPVATGKGGSVSFKVTVN